MPNVNGNWPFRRSNSSPACGFLVSSWGEPQKHAPSVAQCRSDAAAWNKEENTGPKDKDVGYQLPFGEALLGAICWLRLHVRQTLEQKSTLQQEIL